MTKRSFIDTTLWSELSEALSKEHLKQSGLGGLRSTASADPGFERLKTILKDEPAKKKGRVSPRIVKKLAR